MVGESSARTSVSRKKRITRNHIPNVKDRKRCRSYKGAKKSSSKMEQNQKDSLPAVSKQPNVKKHPLAHDSKDFINKTLSIYKVTPLYRFSYESTQLEKYTQSLTSLIESMNIKSLVHGRDALSYRVDITVLEDLKHTANDYPAVQIVVKSNESVKKSSIPILIAVLCCVDRQEIILAENLSFVVLPLMLVRGPEKITCNFISWLESKFDCSVKPMQFDTTSLSWMFSLWTKEVDSESNHSKVIQLTYEVPKKIEGISELTLTLDPSDCKTLWQRLRSEDESFLSQKDMVSFIKAIEDHFCNHLRIPISAMILKRIGTPVALIDCVGKLKIYKTDCIWIILAHLTELALEQAVTIT